MKKIIKKMSLSILLVAAIVAGGCSERDVPRDTEISLPETPLAEEPPVNEPPLEEPPAGKPEVFVHSSVLTGSEWELTAFENATTGEITAPAPAPDDICYRLSFRTDSFYTGLSTGSIIYGYYCADARETIRLYPGNITFEAERSPDGEIFCDALRDATCSFLLSDGELKIVNREKNVSLLFKPVSKESAAASTLTGTMWKLTAFVNRKTGEASAPKELYMSFVLWFKTDGRFAGRSSSNSMAGKYSVDLSSGTIDIQGWTLTYAGENPDGYLFIETLERGIHPYELSENELRIFGNNDFYLQFKLY
ncbi:MAG: META domain-containing protein [Tannerella sp.]|nr:META domain-containing protein [Tannerella sp.]